MVGQRLFDDFLCQAISGFDIIWLRFYLWLLTYFLLLVTFFSAVILEVLGLFNTWTLLMLQTLNITWMVKFCKVESWLLFLLRKIGKNQLKWEPEKEEGLYSYALNFSWVLVIKIWNLYVARFLTPVLHMVFWLTVSFLLSLLLLVVEAAAEVVFMIGGDPHHVTHVLLGIPGHHLQDMLGPHLGAVSTTLLKEGIQGRNSTPLVYGSRA